ncbi:MAG: hypothetical protein PHU06_04455 [Gallionella sp.]|nr:hypothetical protein [Gallionella sp.]MDD4957932.1 hypothetical protein [Gallionella sp.]
MAYFAEHQLIEGTWLSETKMMDTKDCKKEYLDYLDAVSKHRHTRLVVDMRTMFFTYNPELQAWIDQTIFPSLLSIGLRRIAFIVSKDFFATLSTKQMMGELNGVKFANGYFDSKETAKEWALSAV